MLGDGAPDVDGLLDEDAQEFRVQFFFAGCEKAAGLCGQGGRLRLGCDGDLCAEQLPGIEQGEGLAGLLLELRVGREGGVLAEVLEIDLQFAAQAVVVRVVLEGRGEGCGVTLLLVELSFDAVAVGGFGLLGVKDPLQVGRAMLQGLDVDAQGGQAMGDLFEGCDVCGGLGS